MPNNYFGKGRDVDAIVDEAVKGTPPTKPAANNKAAMDAAEAKFRRGRQRASDSRIHGNLELASKAAKDLLEGTMEMNRLKRNQNTDSNN